MKKIIFTGGGTGGHIMPNLAIINELKGFKIYYLGSNGMEKQILSNYPNVEFIEIPVVRLERKLTPKNLAIPIKLLQSINKCKQIIKEISPDIIFSKGGFVSLPVAIAGSRLHIPILTHESDLTIGLANKIIGKISKHLCCSFLTTAQKYGKNAIHTGSPIRTQIFKGNPDKVLSKYNMKKNKPVILVTGGSLGASAINQAIWNNLKELTEKYIIFHLVGKGKMNTSYLKQKNYFQIEFVNDIENYFALADMVISRAGSNTIFELLSLHKPMILIPLPAEASRGDQILNANDFEKNKLANILYQENITKKNLLEKINETYQNRDKFISNQKKYPNANGNKVIVDLINKIAK